MEQEIIRLERFQGTDIRIIRTEIGPAMPAGDIAEALGCTRKNVTEIIKNNPHLFKGVSITSTLQTEGGPQKAVFLNRDGLIGILMRVHPSGSKTLSGKKRIEMFHEWARNVLSQALEGLPVPDQAPQAPPGWATAAEQHIRFARTISRELGMPENWCLTVALQQIERESGISMSQYRKLIMPIQAPASPGGLQAPGGAAARLIQAPDPVPGPGPQAPAGPALAGPGGAAAVLAAGPPGDQYISVSQIARIVRMRADEVNRYLMNTGYQVRDPSGVFHLTEKGSRFGRYFPYCSGQSGHSGEYIKWDRAVIRDSKMLESRPTRIAG